jgi:type II restriction/modification system DNA methylase subunit YeeA
MTHLFVLKVWEMCVLVYIKAVKEQIISLAWITTYQIFSDHHSKMLNLVAAKYSHKSRLNLISKSNIRFKIKFKMILGG